MPKKQKTKEKRRDEKTPDYLPIGPVVDEGTYSEYADVLEHGVLDSEIKNIGIIAPYGTGKSSLIKTWLHKNPSEGKDTRFVSLASFRSADVPGEKAAKTPPPPASSSTDLTLSSIERGILKQLLFGMPPRKLPRSRISRIRNLWPKTMGLVVFLISSLASFALAALCHQRVDPFTVMADGYWAWGIIGMLFFGAFLVLLVFWSSSIKLSTKNIEVEIKQTGSESVLSLFLDEVIYYFKRSKKRIVVFEDIDRFDNLEIFVRLRELNTILNSSEQIRKKITFIYAIKDELFKDREGRLKFFDLVISPIPMTGRQNARRIMKQSLEDAKVSQDFDEGFADDVSAFLVDPRTIKSTINDYLSFMRNLEIKPDERAKLLVFSAYKNLLPFDFAELQKGKGGLWQLLSCKAQWLRRSLEDIDEEIIKIHEQIDEKRKTQVAKEMQELRERVAGIVAFNGQSRQSNAPDIADLRSLSSFKSSGKYLGFLFNNSYGFAEWRCLPESDIKKYLGCTPKEAEQAILGETESQIGDLEAKAKGLAREKETMKTMALKDIASQDLVPPERLECFGEQKGAVLYFIQNGLLDESCLRFISGAKGSVESPTDDAFVKAVLTKEKMEDTYSIERPDLVIKDLGIDHFKDSFVWNVDLVQELLTATGKDALDKLDAVCERLAGDSSDQAVAFLRRVSTRNDVFESLVDHLLRKSNALVNAFLLDTSPSVQMKAQMVRAIMIAFAANPGLVEIGDLPVAPIVNDDDRPIENYLRLLKEPSLLNKVIVGCRLCLSKVDELLYREKEFDQYYEALLNNKALVANEWNLLIICEKYAGTTEISIKNLTSIDLPFVKPFVQDSLKEIASVIANGAKKPMESEESILLVLGQESMEEAEKTAYLGHVKGLVDLQKVQDGKYYLPLLANGLIQPSWRAVALLMKHGSISDEQIGEFIVMNSSVFSNQSADGVTEEDKNRLLIAGIKRLDKDAFLECYRAFNPLVYSFSEKRETKVPKGSAAANPWLDALVKHGFLKIRKGNKYYFYQATESFFGLPEKEQADASPVMAE